jgi:hypothetical protein
MQAAPMTETKPYRPNVGVALFNAFGHVLIGRRFRDDGPEIVLPGLEWQMPQGGIEQTKIRARQRCANSGKRPAQSMLNISMRLIG